MFICIGVTVAKAYAQDVQNQSTPTEPNGCLQKQPNIIFEPLTIFDESEKGITFLHRWANAIHINTKQLTPLKMNLLFSQ